MLRIPLIYLKDKQAYGESMLSLLGKPIDLARRLKDDGYKLIHLIDQDALAGRSTNLDIYDHLTYFINVEVECAPRDEIVKKLLSLKCRVVLPPDASGLSALREKKLIVAKVSGSYAGHLDDFHDVVVEDADEDAVKRFLAMGKRVIIYEKDLGKIKSKEVKKQIWGVLVSSPL